MSALTEARVSADAEIEDVTISPDVAGRDKIDPKCPKGCVPIPVIWPGATILHAALGYATRGWSVFPAPASGEKKSLKAAVHSHGSAWGKTTDAAEIRRGFARWPDANVGLPTGAASGFFLVEADTPEGHDVDGIASVRALEAVHGPLPRTLMAESPSASLHFYYKWPVGTIIRNSTSKIGPGIDVRGEGGMVMAPPSRRPGRGTYRWLNDLPLANAPAWLIELCSADGSDEQHAPGRTAGRSKSRGVGALGDPEQQSGLGKLESHRHGRVAGDRRRGLRRVQSLVRKISKA